MADRRFLITKADAEIVILALTAALDVLNADEGFKNSAYWDFNKLAMERLRDRLINYKWYKD